jgi:steroid 5-alpha reductase family enzyme
MPAVLGSLIVALPTWAAMTAVMLLAWLFQRRKGNGGWVDVFWTFGTGLVCIAAALLPMHGANPVREALVASLTGVWSLRLGMYIGRRVATGAEDARYVELKREWGGEFHSRLLRFVMWQPPVSTLIALSVHTAAHVPGPLGWRDLAGLPILALAIGGEALADEQMRRYRQAKNKPPVMDRGLWGLSRHPNYFFEWLTWLALPIIALSPLLPLTWLTLLAPGVMYLVLRHGTGVPILERSMLARKGEQFREYQQRVSAFFPSLPKRKSAPC